MDMNQLPVVTNNHDLDNAVIGETAQLGCIIQTDDWYEGSPLETGTATYPTFTKPAGAYQSYVSKNNIPAGYHQSYTLTKYKGYTNSFTASMEVKSSVSAGVLGCDASLEVTTGFTWETTIQTSVEESWTTSVDGGDNGRDYWTYQTVLLYANQVRDTPDVRSYLEMQAVSYKAQGGYCYYFAPVYRNSPSILDHDPGYITQSDMVDYLLNGGWNKWYSPVPIVGSGVLYHQGSGKYIVAENGSSSDHTKLILFHGYPSDFNTYVLTRNGYLYHNGSGKPVVAENGSSDNHTKLILFAGQASTFNTYVLNDGGYLYHRGSNKFVVAENGSSDDHTKMILFAGQPSSFNFLSFTK